MSVVHRLRTRLAASACRELVEQASALGVRIGWLELDSAATAPPELEQAAALGVLRSVGVTSDRVLVVKPIRGSTVLQDLLREHFAGCRLVLIRGHVDGPELLGDPSGYKVRFEDGAEKTFTAEELAKALRKPRLRKPKNSTSAAPSAAE